MQLLRKIAFPFSLLYAVVVYLRNVMYDQGIFSSKTFKTPTICVGNLSTGGTGKTPMIEWLLKHISSSGKLAVLSRGYRRKSSGFLHVKPELSPEEVGDEPLQISKKFPQYIVAVDSDRQRGIQQLEEKFSPGLILLDDAFQHRKVTASMYILLTAFNDLYIDDWYLPTGNLRDHKKEAHRADFIIITKCPLNLSTESQEAIRGRLKPLERQQLLFCGFEYGKEVHGPRGSKNLRDLGDEILLVTGIANPDPLIDFMEVRGINFTHRRFPDHHFFSEGELKELRSFPVILTTEKDFTRMNGHVPNAYYLSVKHVFLGNGKELLSRAIENL
ncbi:MAG: tetraacyldisaccharide 4'-kinase [Eudoraea sp.]|nr:tetraacyldisaccharide 4'-kinase [Eudoraea sp.]